MTDDVSMVACEIGCIYMHQAENMNCENEIEVVEQTSSAQMRVGSDVSICTNTKI